MRSKLIFTRRLGYLVPLTRIMIIAGTEEWKSRARSIQPKYSEISVKNSMDRFGPTRKVSKKLVHLLRWTTFPGRTGRKFLVEWIAPQQPYGPTSDDDDDDYYDFSVDSGNNGRNVGGGGGGGVAMPVHCLTKTFVVTIKHLFFFCRRILLTALS